MIGIDGRVSDVAPSPESLAVLEPGDRIVVGARSEVLDDSPFVRAFFTQEILAERTPPSIEGDLREPLGLGGSTMFDRV